MKLIIQIPCYNEEQTLPSVLVDIPETISGIDTIETLVIDDGSTDGTAEVATANRVTHIVRNDSNKGLARTFTNGLDACLALDADIIVNTDGDNQYASADIALLVAPIIAGEADIVIGDRGGMNNAHFSFFKRCLQVFGSTVIGKLSGVAAKDAVSGFRAMSRNAAKELNIVSDFSYTIEMLVQAGTKRLKVTSVPIRTNAKTRESRLFDSIPQFLKMSVMTLLRVYTMYKPLRVFTLLAAVAILVGIFPVARFIYFYWLGEGGGHIQSLILGSTLITLGALTFLVGLVADLISFNRKLMEKNLLLSKNIEEKLARMERK